MCNPRRVEITATRELRESWQSEVKRTVELDAEVAGMARVRQALGDVLGAPALRALEMALAEGDAEWRPVDEGYRRDVEGGYALYRSATQELEIVAVRHRRVQARGSARAKLSGELHEEIAAQGAGTWYDDEEGGLTEERARGNAERQAAKALDAEAERRRDAAVDAAASEAGLAAQAEAEAQRHLDEARDTARGELANEAAEDLDRVGHTCRQAFHKLLARAYRDAILAYARRQGAEIVADREDDDVLEIEFQWRG